MFASLHKVKPVWAVTFLFLCASTVHAQSSEPVDPLQASLQAGIAAFEKGDYDQAIQQLDLAKRRASNNFQLASRIDARQQAFIQEQAMIKQMLR